MIRDCGERGADGVRRTAKKRKRVESLMKKTDTQRHSRAALLKHFWLDQSHHLSMTQPELILDQCDSSSNTLFVCHQTYNVVRSEPLPVINNSLDFYCKSLWAYRWLPHPSSTLTSSSPQNYHNGQVNGI